MPVITGRLRVFTWREIFQAYLYSKRGGQSLHLHNIVFSSSPNCFIRAVNKGDYIGHLFDMDELRLIKTARRLGVKVIFIDGEKGTCRQHIDLCGMPLRRLLREVGKEEMINIKE